MYYHKPSLTMKLYFQYSGIAATVGFLYTFRLPSKKNHLIRYTSTECNAMVKSFSAWSDEWFKGVDIPCPVFRMSGNNIKVLTHPYDFYQELLSRSANAKKRITLASLYLGNGYKEEKLVNTIYENLKNSSNSIDVNILLECTRGSRGLKNSRTLLLPLVKEFQQKTNVALFHSPNLRGIWKAIVPARFDETLNVTHLKVYLFDDTLIMSGANLSHDYFTNRQDRYIIFEGCKELCDYFDDLVKTVSKFSFSLQPDDTLELHSTFLHHPYLGSKHVFNLEASKILCDFTKRYSKHAFDRNLSLPHDEMDENYGVIDTLVFPLIQMRYLGITQDELVTNNIIMSAPRNTDLLLATAYFNLTDDYWKAILKTKTNVDLIMAHPKAMGFYKAKGLAGGIPNAYCFISKQRYDELFAIDDTGRVRFLEYQREGWTFHGKGLWAHLQGSYNDRSCNDYSDLPDSPFFTLVGSPNFGKRSVFRDMEAQVGIVTKNDELVKQLISERDQLKQYATLLTSETFKEKERSIAWWVYLIAKFRNDFF